MATYLKTSGISAALDNLICEAKEKLYIISPYLKLSDHIKELLKDKEREKVEVRFIFGKKELNPEELSFLQGLKYVRLYFSKNLHAKCYINEKKMIITSMNLFEYSQQNNKEMGILINREDISDRQVYDDAWKDVGSILYNESDLKVDDSQHKENISSERHRQRIGLIENKCIIKVYGYCIRTGVEIPFDMEKPMSYEAYKLWNKYQDENYAERYCHYSGERSNGETSISKPVLRKYWKKALEASEL